MVLVSSKGIINARLKRVVADWSEYSGQSLNQVVELVKVGSELAKNEWRRIVHSLSDEEIFKFYSQLKYYIYEILQPYLNPEAYNKDGNYFRIVKFVERLLKRRGSCRALDFGGGLGGLSLLLHVIGCEVIYSDLLGIMSDFARRRFEKYGVSIRIVYLRINGIDLPDNEFDPIVSDAVIEHLKREYLKNFIKEFSESLKEEGHLYLLWDPTYAEEYPYHILGLKAEDLDRELEKYHIYRISENIYVKSDKLYSRLRHIVWLTYKKGLHLYIKARGIAKRFLTDIRYKAMQNR